MDAAMALDRMRDLLRPGGTLAVVGLARSQYPLDLPRVVAAVIANRIHRLTKHYWQVGERTCVLRGSAIDTTPARSLDPSYSDGILY